MILTVGQVEARVKESSGKESLGDREPGGWARLPGEQMEKFKDK